MAALCTVGFLASNTSQAQSNPYGAPSFNGPIPFIGESPTNEASIINCRCATLIVEGKASEDLSCANFKNLYQRQIMSAGSTGIINAPGQTLPH